MAVNCDLITQDIRYISLPSWGYETHKKQNNDTPKKKHEKFDNLENNICSRNLSHLHRWQNVKGMRENGDAQSHRS